jgi:hypothetical protein
MGNYINPATGDDIDKILESNIDIPISLSNKDPLKDSSNNNISSSFDLNKSIVEVPSPTIRGNWDSIQKLVFWIVGAAVLLGIMVAIARPDTRRRIGTYVVLSLLAYTFEVVFLAIVVIPYKHIGDVEVVYESTKTESMDLPKDIIFLDPEEVTADILHGQPV